MLLKSFVMSYHSIFIFFFVPGPGSDDSNTVDDVDGSGSEDPKEPQG